MNNVAKFDQVVGLMEVVITLVTTWATTGAVITLVYMIATGQLDGTPPKSWRDVIPARYKRVMFIILLGPVTFGFYGLGVFLKWLRRE
jgi:hypothetical protein